MGVDELSVYEDALPEWGEEDEEAEDESDPGKEDEE